MKKLLAILLLAATPLFANPFLVCPNVTGSISNSPTTYTVSGLPNSPITANAVTVTAGTVQLDLDLGAAGQNVPYGTYTVSATASNTNGTSSASGNTTLNVPAIATPSTSSLTSTTVTLNSNLTQDGGTAATHEGFYWGTTASYGNTADSGAGSFTSGAFSQNLTGLTASTTYHYQAYAYNGNCGVYGPDETFTASAGATNQALAFSGTGQYLTTSSALVSSYPYTLAAWVYVTSTSATGNILSIGSTNTNFSYAEIAMASGGDVLARADGGSAGASSTSSTAMSTGAWHLVVGVFTSATSRTVYLDGTAATTSTTSETPPSVNVTTVAGTCENSATPGSLFAGSIAYPTIWSVALSGTDVTNLWNSGSGVAPNTIESGSVVSYSPFQGSTPWANGVGAGTWTTTGSPTAGTAPF